MLREFLIQVSVSYFLGFSELTYPYPISVYTLHRYYISHKINSVYDNMIEVNSSLKFVPAVSFIDTPT